MKYTLSTTYSSDGVKWRCQKLDHTKDVSIQRNSWFEGSNMTLEEVIELTYWWSTGTEQVNICQEMGLSSATIVDWANFLREICDEIVIKRSKPIGGKGVKVQIDESKFGKQKYHRGHKVEGQWVFGGIESESRKNFMIPVEKRDRNTLIPIIERYILPGTTIVSDCWKAYDILDELDYHYLKVNHSIEFVNESGDHTNKIEGHWRQAKAVMPKFGVRKKFFSSHLGEFMWRYENKDKNLFMQIISDISSIYNF
ncbi:uncharacterized protein LOC130614603 [Hydractinia symbiolongicarpus]|uniref:uncharacterized protein LOC130614603 n=1 Tax=Hydractinia symbiolongicarpus TaxID=13093 RepID=UPI00254E13AC|nr:uncharacterized protein LOC130614603 [Hydractinia symbiolongicarpus]